MAKSALIVGGTGQIGVAVARDLLAHSWAVRIAHRGGHAIPDDVLRAGATEVLVDREDAAALVRAVGDGADAVIDCVAFGPEHARQLLALSDRVGSLAVVSSASVYRDAAGRTLDEAPETGFPEFDGPISETNPTVPPGPETYSTRKVALERLLLDEARVPVTVLRPCAIHGPRSSHAREWWFIKRALDGRTRVPVAYEGLSRFHTTATANLAQACRLSLEAGGTRVLNVGDPEPPSVREIGEAIGAALGHAWEVVGLPGAPRGPQGSVGRTPWSVPRPFLIDTAAAAALGYSPVTDYAGAVRETCQALREAGERAGADWPQVFPALAAYSYPHFDYEVEDEVLAAV
jgi:nucleoside-diphosphate-sugar epimerase